MKKSLLVGTSLIALLGASGCQTTSTNISSAEEAPPGVSKAIYEHKVNAVKEQVESLGAKFVEVESSEDDGVGEGGYAKETSDEYKEKQQALMREHIVKSDLVITTALIPGKAAPILVSKDMVDAMKKGSVVVDLAAENGGNCEYTKAGEVINQNDIIIDGTLNLPSSMQVHSSQLYAKNISTFITHMMKEGNLNIDLDDEIISGSIFTHQGKITHEPTQQAVDNL